MPKLFIVLDKNEIESHVLPLFQKTCIPCCKMLWWSSSGIRMETKLQQDTLLGQVGHLTPS